MVRAPARRSASSDDRRGLDRDPRSSSRSSPRSRRRWAAYMARVFRGEPVLLTRVAGPVERAHVPASRVDPERGQDWKGYARSVLVLSAVFGGALYLILRTQSVHPWNPRDLGAAPWDLSFNTARRSSPTRTGSTTRGETTMSSFSQMAGLAVQNFVSAGVGIAVLIAVHPRPRGALRQRSSASSTSTSRARSSTCCCRCRRRRAGPRLPGRRPEPARADARRPGSRAGPDVRARPGRLAGGDQGARAPTAAASST